MAELFLELFSEEIPARMQAGAQAELARRLTDGFKEAGYGTVEVQTWSTPRRLTAAIADLPDKQPDLREERKGPKVGAPEKAVDGFLKSVGLTLDQVEQRETDKGPVYFAVIERKGRPTPEVIAGIVTQTIQSFHWPKSQRWGEGRLRWVRPLHRIVCLFGGTVVPFEVEGIASGDETEGHRFMARGPFTVTGLDEYQAKMAESSVMLDPAERRSRIDADARALVKDEGFELVEDPGLLAEVTGLVEWPVALMGRFDETFLDLPDEVLTAAMRGHQKYFSVRDPKTKRLAPRFVTVANLVAQDGGTQIIAGNERVLRARLSDAKFFWDQDRKTPLEDRLPKLKDVVFHAQLGTVAEKVERVAALARTLAKDVNADPDQAERAARLVKADLVTDMVYEFPELQGLMGRYYALHGGEPEAVADAIADHYAPAGPNDHCPDKPVSMAVALADKLDTLTGFWAIGEKPTGSKDPFALRRAALGVIRIILENDLRLRLGDLFAAGLKQYTERTNDKIDVAGKGTDLLSFFADRMKVHLREQGTRHDLIDAVFALPDQDDLVLVTRRAAALAEFLQTDDGANLLAGYKRAVNILKIEEKKDKARYDGTADPALFDQDEERALFDRIAEAGAEAQAAGAREDFAAAMGALARLRAPVDAFFDKVTVNADDASVRRNRLALLSQIRTGLAPVADFSKIEG